MDADAASEPASLKREAPEAPEDPRGGSLPKTLSSASPTSSMVPPANETIDIASKDEAATKFQEGREKEKLLEKEVKDRKEGWSQLPEHLQSELDQVRAIYEELGAQGHEDAKYRLVLLPTSSHVTTPRKQNKPRSSKTTEGKKPRKPRTNKSKPPKQPKQKKPRKPRVTKLSKTASSEDEEDESEDEDDDLSSPALSSDEEYVTRPPKSPYGKAPRPSRACAPKSFQLDDQHDDDDDDESEDEEEKRRVSQASQATRPLAIVADEKDPPVSPPPPFNKNAKRC